MPHFNAPETVQLSKDQFEEIVKLLTPGYLLAKQYLDQMTTKLDGSRLHEPPPGEPTPPDDEVPRDDP